MTSFHNIAVIGAGAWGTALASSTVRAGRSVTLWGRDPATLHQIAKDRQNPRYLGDTRLAAGIEAHTELSRLGVADLFLLAVPAQHLRSVAAVLPAGDQPLVICAKGLERGSHLRLSEVLAAVCPGRPSAVLSGPNFAKEVASDLPAAATLGCKDGELGRAIAEALSHRQFRLYWTDDLIGVEIGGAMKNVIAIAAGIVAGRGLGENAAAALITRALAEIKRLGVVLGARGETLMGLAGLGDLILTAGSLTSRNMAFGHAIGKGADPKALQQEPGRLVEGVPTAMVVVRLAEQHGIDVPICRVVASILAGDLDIERASDLLMSRPLRHEAL